MSDSQESRHKTQAKEKSSIAKMVFYFAAFSIIMRSDMWFSLLVIVVVCVYLFQFGLLKKVLARFYPGYFETILFFVQVLRANWREINTQKNPKTPEPGMKKKQSAEAISPGKAGQSLQDEVVTPPPPEN